MSTEPPLPRLPPRRADSHKGDFGKALLIGGSRDMPGSIALSGVACLRSGAGLVTVATSAAAQPIVAGFEPSYMTAALPDDADGRIALTALDRLREFISRATVVAIGPGLGQSADIAELVATLYRETPLPLLVDADGLNALAERQARQPHVDVLADHAGLRILTPHPGEFARLVAHRPATGGRIKAPSASGFERIAAATALAVQTGVVVLLKGHQTVIASGQHHALNHTGNPGMATGGSGDVLTGIITALLAQGLQPFAAAHLGAHLHGLAGDLAAAELGQVSLIASDLLRFLPKAFKDCD